MATARVRTKVAVAARYCHFLRALFEEVNAELERHPDLRGENLPELWRTHLDPMKRERLYFKVVTRSDKYFAQSGASTTTTLYATPG